MTPLRPLCSSTRLLYRACFGAARISTIGLPSRFLAAFPAVIQLHRHSSTMLSLPEDRGQNSLQKMLPTSAKLVGQSGCRYLIERVLQEKGIAAGYVYLATYMLLRLKCQLYRIVDF